MTSERERLRATFERASSRYARARPSYPEPLFDRLLEATGLHAGDSVLEIGPATGVATRPLAERGLAITAVELGADLAAACAEATADFDHVDVICGSFDEAEFGRRFDAVIAATSWHWLAPDTKYRRAARLLEPGGHLAFWTASHVFPVGGDPIFGELQPTYDEIGEALPAGAPWPRPGELPELDTEIDASGLFDVVAIEHFDWSVTYDADSYLDLLDTFSGHLAMESWQRDRLHDEVRRRLSERPAGTLERGWGAVLHVAKVR